MLRLILKQIQETDSPPSYIATTLSPGYNKHGRRLPTCCLPISLILITPRAHYIISFPIKNQLSWTLLSLLWFNSHWGQEIHQAMASIPDWARLDWLVTLVLISCWISPIIDYCTLSFLTIPSGSDICHFWRRNFCKVQTKPWCLLWHIKGNGLSERRFIRGSTSTTTLRYAFTRGGAVCPALYRCILNSDFFSSLAGQPNGWPARLLSPPHQEMYVLRARLCGIGPCRSCRHNFENARESENNHSSCMQTVHLHSDWYNIMHDHTDILYIPLWTLE